MYCFFISHDEDLIENCANVIIHIEQLMRKQKPKISIEKLDYENYVENRGNTIERQERIAKKQREEFDKKQRKYQKIYERVQHEIRSTKNDFWGTELKIKMHTVKSIGRRLEKEKENLLDFPDYEESIFVKFDEAVNYSTKKEILDLNLEKLVIGSKVLSENEIKEFIEKDIRVESAKVEKNSLGEITIDVKEKDLVYYAVIGKNIYLTDKDGKIFAYLNEKEVEGVPFIIANSEEEVKEISEFLNEISDLAIFQKISQIYKVKDKEFVIILTDGVKIKTNRIKDSNDEINKEKENKRYIIAEQLYFNMSKERKIDYIDLRFNDYIIKYLGDSK